MDKTKFWICLCVALIVSSNNSIAQINQINQQRNNPFNQNNFRRVTPFNQQLQQQQQQQQQPFNQPQPFQRISPVAPISPLLQAQNAYNPRYNQQNYVPITAYQNELNYDGSFSYGYSTADGTTAQAQGFVKNLGVPEIEAQVIQGSYSYTAPDGSPIRVTYIADENGFRAEGAHIPTPPPIPDAIAKSLDYIQRNQIYNQDPSINQNINPNINPNLNPFQTPQQFQQQQRQNQINPIPLQQQQILQQQQSGQYAPQLQYQQPQQRQFQPPLQFQGNPLNNPLLQQQQQQQQQKLQQQQQLQQNPQQQILTQQLQGRGSELLTQQIDQFDFNKFRRYKKETKKQQYLEKQLEKLQKPTTTPKPIKRNSIKVNLP